MRKGIVGKKRSQRRDAFVGNEYAQRRAGDRQHHRFRQQLANQPAASRADGDAHGQLVLPRCSPRQQQDRNVGAPDDQQCQHGAEEQRQRSGEFAEHFFVQRDDLYLAVLRIVLIAFRKLVDQCLKLGLCRGKFRAGL